jgi:hypothetical protein
MASRIETIFPSSSIGLKLFQSLCFFVNGHIVFLPFCQEVFPNNIQLYVSRASLSSTTPKPAAQRIAIQPP